jgi:hypothetical protein
MVCTAFFSHAASTTAAQRSAPTALSFFIVRYGSVIQSGFVW